MTMYCVIKVKCHDQYCLVGSGLDHLKNKSQTCFMYCILLIFINYYALCKCHGPMALYAYE